MAWDIDFRLPDRGFFDAAQRAGIEVLFDAIQPSDPDRGIPGARDAGAAEFLDLLLAREEQGDGVKIHADLPAWRRDYPQWLAQLQDVASARFGRALADLSEAEAREIVAGLESGNLSGFAGDQKKAFATIWRHCLQGCWSDPRWGGNRDRIMWRWLGHLYDPQAVTVQPKGSPHAHR